MSISMYTHVFHNVINRQSAAGWHKAGRSLGHLQVSEIGDECLKAEDIVAVCRHKERECTCDYQT